MELSDFELKEFLDKGLTHSIHTSERRSFRSCRRRWDWAYRQYYYPRVNIPALEFGVAFHKAMEKIYDPVMWDHDEEVKLWLAQVAFRQSSDEQLKNYRRLNGEPEVRILEEYKDRINLGLNMIRHYCETVLPVYDNGFRPVRVEVPFEVLVLSPERNPLWCKCGKCFSKWLNFIAPDKPADVVNFKENIWGGLPVSYGGRIDMLAEDEHGRLWIFDWKSTSRILDEDAESSFLQLDDQIASYVWALRSLNLPVAGFVYVEIKKAYPQPPEELTRSRKGKQYSTNKQWMTTAEMFSDHVQLRDPVAFNEGLYDEHIQWLKDFGPKFHQRHQVHKTDYEVDQIGRNIYLEAQDFIQNPRVYPMPGRFSCPSCLYRQPCIGMNAGEDYEYTLKTMFEQKTRHFYEEEPSTD